MESRKVIITWIAITIVVMFALPFAVVRLAFDIKEVWFIIYAAVCLIIGWTAMDISRYLNKRNTQNN